MLYINIIKLFYKNIITIIEYKCSEQFVSLYIYINILHIEYNICI